MGAGIPGEVVHHLPNPVSAHFLGRPADSEEVKGRFERHMASDFPGYCPGAPWSLFPVRAIRRKNILEAALGTLLFPEKLNLVVSLPGLSSQEQGYSNLVEGLYRGGVIPGLWGTGLWRGLRAPQFEDLALSVDLVFSSSLQEGFGFFFIDAFRWGKPLFSRSLDILDEILSILPDNRAVLYDSLRVPPEQRWIQGWKKHLAALDRRLPEPVRSSMPELPGAEHFLSPDGWDFSALTPDDQAKVLRRIAADSGYLREIKRGNPRFCQNAEVILGERPFCSAENLTVLQARWGLAAFGRKVSDLLNQDSREVDFPHSQGREEKVLAAFTTPENMRPLFFPYPGVNYE